MCANVTSFVFLGCDTSQMKDGSRLKCHRIKTRETVNAIKFSVLLLFS